jgi:hypothetical protein
VLTWSGLRGGISVAMVLSLLRFPARDLLLACTYAVVVFSRLVQALTVRRLLVYYRGGGDLSGPAVTRGGTVPGDRWEFQVLVRSGKQHLEPSQGYLRSVGDRTVRSRIQMSLNFMLPWPPECSWRAMPPSNDLGLGSVKSIIWTPLRRAT